jgi:hypothetical protein
MGVVAHDGVQFKCTLFLFTKNDGSDVITAQNTKMNKLTKEQVANLKKIGCEFDENSYTSEEIMNWGLKILSANRPDEQHRCNITATPQENNAFFLTVQMFPKSGDDISKLGYVVFTHQDESQMQCLYEFAIWCDEISKISSLVLKKKSPNSTKKYNTTPCRQCAFYYVLPLYEGELKVCSSDWSPTYSSEKVDTRHISISYNEEEETKNVIPQLFLIKKLQGKCQKFNPKQLQE